MLFPLVCGCVCMHLYAVMSDDTVCYLGLCAGYLSYFLQRE